MTAKPSGQSGIIFGFHVCMFCVYRSKIKVLKQFNHEYVKTKILKQVKNCLDHSTRPVTFVPQSHTGFVHRTSKLENSNNDVSNHKNLMTSPCFPWGL